MERKFDNLTPVKHKSKGYKGWIDGTTSYFPSRKDGEWRYRVYIKEGLLMEIAPEEDLEIDRNPGFPPKDLILRYSNANGNETELHMLGYNLSLNETARINKLNDAVSKLGIRKVISELCQIIEAKFHLSNAFFERYKVALGEWNKDLDYILINFYFNSDQIEVSVLERILYIKRQFNSCGISGELKEDNVEIEIQKRRSKV